MKYTYLYKLGDIPTSSFASRQKAYRCKTAKLNKIFKEKLNKKNVNKLVEFEYKLIQLLD